MSRALLAALCAATALVLSGCGGSSSSGGGGGGGGGGKKSTVIIMRHCLRSTPGNLVDAEPKFKFDDNYSKDPWPQWSVPAYHCLPRGEDIIESQGRWWGSKGGFRKPLRVVADLLQEDNGQRDNVTMHRFLAGLGASSFDVSDVSVSLDHGPFAPVDTPECQRARPSAEELMASSQEHMKANPPPAGYDAQLKRLVEVLGEGVAGSDWPSLPCNYSVRDSGLPIPSGGCNGAAAFAERLLMEWGSGDIKVGWGNLKLEEIPKLFMLEMWYFYNWFAPELVSRYFGASIIRSVLSGLDDEGTTIYVGHDSDMMKLKGAVGLVWDPEPFPSNSTLPGSMLRLDRDGDQVTASYVYVGNFSSNSGEMLSVPARFQPSNTSTLSLAELLSRLKEGSIEACAYNHAATVETTPAVLAV